LSEIEKHSKDGSADALLLTDAIPSMQKESELRISIEREDFRFADQSKYNPHFAGDAR